MIEFIKLGLDLMGLYTPQPQQLTTRQLETLEDVFVGYQLFHDKEAMRNEQPPTAVYGFNEQGHMFTAYAGHWSAKDSRVEQQLQQCYGLQRL